MNRKAVLALTAATSIFAVFPADAAQFEFDCDVRLTTFILYRKTWPMVAA